MKRSGSLLLVIGFILACGLTACGNNCNNFCNKVWGCALDLDYDAAKEIGYPDVASCENACNSSASIAGLDEEDKDCARDCNTDQLCEDWSTCLRQCGLNLEQT